MKATGEFTVENFELHHAKNPHVYAAFSKYAKQVALHRDYFSAKAIFHRIRWDSAIGEFDSEFKISDGWISHYARKFMKDNPQYDGFFKTKVRRVSYFEDEKNDPWDIDEDDQKAWDFA